MTSRRRPFPDAAPAPPSQTYAIGRTVRAGAGELLAQAANNAAVGYLAQRWTLPRNQGGAFNLFYLPSAAARYLMLNALISRVSATTTTVSDTVTIAITITDGTSTVMSSDTRIPEGWRADIPWSCGVGVNRWAAANRLEAFIDLDALAVGSPSLDASVPWRVTVTITCGSSLEVAAVTAEELPRWMVDDSEGFGVLPGLILPRAQILAAPQTVRLFDTIEAGYACPRTYLSISRDEASGPYLTATGTSAAAFTGWSESAGASIKHRVRVHAPGVLSSNGGRFRAKCRYRLTGGSAGDTSSVIVTTSAGTAGITLHDHSGAWVDSDVWVGYLATNGTGKIDTIELTGLVSKPGSTLDLDALTVWAYPE
jgi:hypothetical protein